MEIPGVVLLAFTALALPTVIVAALVARARGHERAAKAIGLTAAAYVGAYATILVATSVTSHERTLPLGETKRFCGFYLDCHMGVAVERVDTMSSIGEPGNEIRAGGAFYVATLRVSSNAVRAPLRLESPRFVIVDREGFEYERLPPAEEKLAGALLADLEQTVAAGDSFTRTIVIDVPQGVRQPRLHVTMGGSLARLAELAIIGDEDALLHSPTLHALSSGSGLSSASAGRP